METLGEFSPLGKCRVLGVPRWAFGIKWASGRLPEAANAWAELGIVSVNLPPNPPKKLEGCSRQREQQG